MNSTSVFKFNSWMAYLKRSKRFILILISVSVLPYFWMSQRQLVVNFTEKSLVVANSSYSTMNSPEQAEIKNDSDSNQTDNALDVEDFPQLPIDHDPNYDNLQLCPQKSPDLKGLVATHMVGVPSFKLQENQHPELKPDGTYRPTNCKARQKVAIIIPYRNRTEHLKILMNHMHPFLQRQQIEYTFFVVEQAGYKIFNRGMLKNIGALEAMKIGKYDCFIFHDVDLLPENDHNTYSCPGANPKHLAASVSTLNYKLAARKMFGGVIALKKDHLLRVNGYSNRFWGWGAEDTDLSTRIRVSGYVIMRLPMEISRFKMMSHEKDDPNPLRYQILKNTEKNFKTDGLNSIVYKVLKLKHRKLYTWIYVQLE